MIIKQYSSITWQKTSLSKQISPSNWQKPLSLGKIHLYSITRMTIVITERRLFKKQIDFVSKMQNHFVFEHSISSHILRGKSKTQYFQCFQSFNLGKIPIFLWE